MMTGHGRRPVAAASLFAAAVAAAGGQGGTPAQARDPVAVVERITGGSPAVAEMDYLAAGEVVRLGPHDVLVLGYLRACARETIQGGVVTVGLAASEVENGAVHRQIFVCDAGRLRLKPPQSAASGVTVLRGGPARVAQPEITIQARSPVVDGLEPGLLLIERTDKPADRVAIAITSEMLTRRSVDLLSLGIVLEAGGRYVMTAGERRLGFAVSGHARTADGPLLLRLLRL